jgi:hypothetical protein
MADEFIKGLGILTGAGLGWMVLASWYRTPSFESTEQLVAPLTVDPSSGTLFDAVGILMLDVLLWFALLGALTFWVVVPAARQAMESIDERAG